MLSFFHTRPDVSLQACEHHHRRLAQAAQDLQPPQQRHVAQAEVKAAEMLLEAVARHLPSHESFFQHTPSPSPPSTAGAAHQPHDNLWGLGEVAELSQTCARKLDSLLLSLRSARQVPFTARWVDLDDPLPLGSLSQALVELAQVQPAASHIGSQVIWAAPHERVETVVERFHRLGQDINPCEQALVQERDRHRQLASSIGQAGLSLRALAGFVQAPAGGEIYNHICLMAQKDDDALCDDWMAVAQLHHVQDAQAYLQGKVQLSLSSPGVDADLHSKLLLDAIDYWSQRSGTTAGQKLLWQLASEALVRN